jgi:hypothetical protein
MSKNACFYITSDKGIYPLALSRHCEARSNPVSHKINTLQNFWIASQARNDGVFSTRGHAPLPLPGICYPKNGWHSFC